MGDTYNYCSISHSYATGSVSGSFAGGLVGATRNFSSISNSSAVGSVSGNFAGGLAGGSYYYSSISNSYATGSVSGEYYIGGLAGANDNSFISNSYASGSVNGNTAVGGLIGESIVPASNYYCNNYWDREASGQDNPNGIGDRDYLVARGRTTAQMKRQSTFRGWDFQGTWYIEEGRDYPRLNVLAITYPRDGDSIADGRDIITVTGTWRNQRPTRIRVNRVDARISEEGEFNAIIRLHEGRNIIQAIGYRQGVVIGRATINVHKTADADNPGHSGEDD